MKHLSVLFIKATPFFFLILAFAFPAVAQSEPPWIGVVDRVLDGDSLIINSGGKAVEVRLYGVDCPEYRQAYGKEAFEFTSHVAGPGQQVTVYPKGVDQHGRVVARVFVDKKELNLELIRAGLAWWYARYAPLMTNYFEAQKEARKLSRGLWAQANPVPPWIWRKKNPPPPKKKSLLWGDKKEAESPPK
jgi:micrococcal nuclease